MKKHNYRTKNVNEINWPELRQQLGGGAVTFTVDVAKAQQYALLTDTAQNVSTISEMGAVGTPRPDPRPPATAILIMTQATLFPALGVEQLGFSGYETSPPA